MVATLRIRAADARALSAQSRDWAVKLELEGRALAFLELADHPVPKGIRRRFARAAFRTAELHRLNGDWPRQRFFTGIGQACADAAEELP